MLCLHLFICLIHLFFYLFTSICTCARRFLKVPFLSWWSKTLKTLHKAVPPPHPPSTQPANPSTRYNAITDAQSVRIHLPTLFTPMHNPRLLVFVHLPLTCNSSLALFECEDNCLCDHGVSSGLRVTKPGTWEFCEHRWPRQRGWMGFLWVRASG